MKQILFTLTLLAALFIGRVDSIGPDPDISQRVTSDGQVNPFTADELAG